MTLTFRTLPLSTNQLYRVFNNRSILSAKGRTNKEAIAWEARAQFRGRPLTGPLAIEATFFWGDRRKHDWDNQKAFWDSLNGIVYEDDRQIKDAHIMVEYDKANPRVELRLWNL